MGFIGSIFSNDKGSGFEAQSAPIQSPITDQYALQTGNNVTGALNNQQNFLNQQQAFANALQAQNGIQNQANVFNQLQGVANGTGPNPAQAMLNQATGNNIASQAALMAGQRGVGVNPGLLARQIAQQGANTQQQAAGQGAILQANQSLNALGQLGGISGQQVAQQGGALQNLSGAYQNLAGNNLQAQSNALNAIGNQNTARVGMQSNINNANAGIAGINAQGQQGLVGGALKGLSGVSSLFAEGGVVAQPMVNPGSPNIPAVSNDLTNLGKDDKGGSGGLASLIPAIAALAEGGEIRKDMINDGKPKSLIGKHLSGQKSSTMTKQAGVVPGKAQVAGNSYANDKVKALLSPGEVVLPRSVTQSKDPVNAAAAFMAAIVAKHGKR